MIYVTHTTVFLARERKGLSYLITLIPALFMTVVCVTYIMFAPEGLSLNYYLSLGIGLGVATLFMILFVRFRSRLDKINTII